MAALTAANTLHYQTQYPVRLVGYTIDDKTYWIATDRRASSLYLLASLGHREISRAAGNSLPACGNQFPDRLPQSLDADGNRLLIYTGEVQP